MINPNHIFSIVRHTLSDMGVNNPAMEKLIKGTFVVESELENLFDYSNKYNTQHGLMLMRRKEVEWVLRDYIPYKIWLNNAIHESTGINVSEQRDDIDTLIGELDYNIRFMIVVLYAYYDSKNTDLEDDLQYLAKVYKKHYCDDDYITEDDFVDMYRETFVTN